MKRSWRSVVLVLTLWLAQIPGQARSETPTYTVQPGDTLFQIGLRYNIDWREIQSLNGLAGAWI